MDNKQSIICRPLHLYNEFLPAEIKGGRKWEYQAFGHHDGISVRDSILLDDASDFEELFDYCVKYETEESYFNQIIWGFHENVECEAAFWCDKEYPFLYLVLLQVAADKQNYREIKEKLEEMYSQGNEDEVSVLFYYSIDNSDLIMMIRSMRADIGFDVVNNLHYELEKCEFSIRNTYSILGVMKKAINGQSDMISEEEKIALLELQVIERERGSLNSLYTELKNVFGDNENKIFRKVVLGTEDDSIFIRDIYWRELLSFYKAESGILNNSNKVSQKYAYAISARVMMREQDTICESDLQEPATIGSPFCDILWKLVKKKQEKDRAEIKNLLKLINAFRRFEYQNDKDRPFTDYNFFPLFLPFYQFVSFVDVRANGFPKYYYHFMKCMKICTQNFTKPERIYSQITDFNIRYFDMPVKLIALYNSFVYCIKNVLNKKMSDKEVPRYEFMICAGVNGVTEVKEIFMRQEKNRHLFLIETPERQMYKTKLMFFVLGHEVAHFVGTEVRNREVRMQQMLKVCSRAIAISLKSYYGYGEKFSISESSEKWKELETKLENWIKLYMERRIDHKYLVGAEYYEEDKMEENVVKMNASFNRAYAGHSEIFQINILEAITDMLSGKGESIVSFMIAEDYEYQKNNGICKESWNDFFNEKYERLKKYIDAFLGITVTPHTSLTIDWIVEKSLFWMKECYADIICILMLRVSLKDYINSLVSSLMEQSINDDLSRKDLVIRVALVMAVMSQPVESEKLFRWTDAEYDGCERWSEVCLNIEDEAAKFLENYIGKEKVFGQDELVREPITVFCDQIILNSIVKYLGICVKSFADKVEMDKDNVKAMERARDFYKMADINNSDEFFSEMMLQLKEYEKNVYEELKKIIEQEEKNLRSDEE